MTPRRRGVLFGASRVRREYDLTIASALHSVNNSVLDALESIGRLDLGTHAALGDVADELAIDGLALFKGGVFPKPQGEPDTGESDLSEDDVVGP